ncbi:hypothetical protein FOL47_000438 [Perkinsus chesapeaki]|uniref:subtilisin n=1 Tax=Perkinsus chesapeaki TaxID=330153 RepID=A0A7J6MLR4_PERCH|nr:hypothetical protein FOL47_000438 [Perkinsus chesapeaki]
MRPCSLIVVYLISPTVTIRQAEGDAAEIGNDPPVNDPHYRLQEPYLEFAGVPAAWRRMASAPVVRRKVTVALVDTGVEPDHPDLVGNLIEGYNVIRNTTKTADKHGHGTLMAGVLGATTNNSIGIAGVTDLINIMPVCLEETFTEETEANGIDYAIRNKNAKGIRIILMAISGFNRKQKVQEKIKQAVAAGMLVIVTAGNGGEDITRNKKYPCALTKRLPGMLCVAATENTEMKLASFSNYADYVDIAAPGAAVATTLLPMRYGSCYGTSPASAIIAGVAAMLYSFNPYLSPVAVERIIKDTSRQGIKRTPKDTLKFGLVDADAAVAKLLSR